MRFWRQESIANRQLIHRQHQVGLLNMKIEWKSLICKWTKESIHTPLYVWKTGAIRISISWCSVDAIYWNEIFLKTKTNQSETTTIFFSIFSFPIFSLEFFYVESDFPALNYTEFVMRNNAKTKTAKNVEMFQYIGVNGGG